MASTFELIAHYKAASFDLTIKLCQLCVGLSSSSGVRVLSTVH